MQRHVKSQNLRRRRQAEEQQKAATSKTTAVLVLLVVAMLIVIFVQLYFLSHDSLPSSFQPASLQEVFPEFATSFSASVSSSKAESVGNPGSSERRNITRGNVIIPNQQLQEPKEVGDANSQQQQEQQQQGGGGSGIGPILKILKQAGHDLNDKELFTPEIFAALPKWEDVSQFYGPPVILGLETCEAFRQAVPKNKRLMSIAGTFNSGTNLLYGVLAANCWNPSMRRGAEAGSGVGIRWQVPWGKHFPAEYRGIHFAAKSEAEVKNVLPIVTIRDPYTWMQSMCRQPYAAIFVHGEDTCPNIVPYPADIQAYPRFKQRNYIPVNIRYDQGMKIKHESLGHFWNEWNGVHLYQNVTADPTAQPEKYPRIMVRMEDIVFRADEVVPQLCDCAGFQHTTELVHHAPVANNNAGVKHSGSGSGLLRSIIKYGNVQNRREGYPDFQLKAAREVLSSEMMKLFQYPYEPLG